MNQTFNLPLLSKDIVSHKVSGSGVLYALSSTGTILTSNDLARCNPSGEILSGVGHCQFGSWYCTSKGVYFVKDDKDCIQFDFPEIRPNLYNSSYRYSFLISSEKVDYLIVNGTGSIDIFVITELEIRELNITTNIVAFCGHVLTDNHLMLYGMYSRDFIAGRLQLGASGNLKVNTETGACKEGTYKYLNDTEVDLYTFALDEKLRFLVSAGLPVITGNPSIDDISELLVMEDFHTFFIHRLNAPMFRKKALKLDGVRLIGGYAAKDGHVLYFSSTLYDAHKIHFKRYLFQFDGKVNEQVFEIQMQSDVINNLVSIQLMPSDQVNILLIEYAAKAGLEVVIFASVNGLSNWIIPALS